MLCSLIVASILLLAGDGGATDDAPLLPGERLEDVGQARLEIDVAGLYTLGRSNGALVLGDRQSSSGWLVVELQPGSHTVELPDGPGDVTALVGAVDDGTAVEFLNQAIAKLNARELPAARAALLACRARPAAEQHHGLARLFLGVVLQRTGLHLEQARELLLNTRELALSFGPDVVALADNSLGQVSLSLGDWGNARAAYERIRLAADDPNLRVMATSGLAQAAAGDRDHTLARQLHEEALVALDTEEGVDPQTVAAVHFEAGRWFETRADFERAAELLGEAARIAPTWQRQVIALGQLGLVERVRGRYGEALGLMDRAQALAQPHSPSPLDAQLLQNRSALAFSLGEYGIAQQSLERLLPLQAEGAQRARVLSNLALLALVQDDEEASAKHYDSALNAAPRDSEARWFALNGKAALLFSRGLPELAAPLAFEAQELAERLKAPHLLSVSLMGTSEAHLRLNMPDLARAQAEAAVASLQDQDARDLLLPALCGVAQAALLQGDEASVVALLDRAWEESGRESIATLSAIEIGQVRSRLSELADWGAVAADLAARRSIHDPASVAAALPLVSRWKARTLLTALGEPPAVPTDPEDFAAVLAAELGQRTLVEYAMGDEHLYAFVLEGDSDGATPRLHNLGERRPIEALVQEFLAGLTNRATLSTAAQVARVGGQLHELLLAPLKLSKQPVVIVPSGELARLPFEALVAAAPEDVQRFDQLEFVIDQMDVAYAPSSSALLALCRRPPPHRDGLALLLGDPRYASEGEPRLLASRGNAARSWERLPQSRDELLRIARLLITQGDDERARDELFQLVQLEDQRNVSLTTSSLELRLGDEATVEALAALAPSASLIHIASHAQVDRWDARRSGLVLAWKAGGQGLFSLADIAALKLDTELVILSACQTAGGRLLTGDGVQSLAGAFLAAGARGVVATLWAVQDEQASELMQNLAAGTLTRGESPDRALRHAKRALRSAGQLRGLPISGERPDPLHGHPHFWAAFLFSGAIDPPAR